MDDMLGDTRRPRLRLLALLTGAAITLAGCGRDDVPAHARAEDPTATTGSRAYADASTATTPARYANDRANSAAGAAGGGSSYGGSSYGDRAQRPPVPMFNGEPLWSDNRQHTAQENAQYHCDKSGADIGATSFKDCLKRVHAFLDHPPEDVQKIKRPNGDTLMYDPKANLFVVARRDGAPRTFFKPTTGADYWKQQQAAAASGGAGSAGGGGNYSRRSAGAADEG